MTNRDCLCIGRPVERLRSSGRHDKALPGHGFCHRNREAFYLHKESELLCRSPCRDRHANSRYFWNTVTSREPISQRPPARQRRAMKNLMISQRTAGHRNSRTAIPISNPPTISEHTMHSFIKHFINSSIPPHLCKCPTRWHHAILIFKISTAV